MSLSIPALEAQTTYNSERWSADGSKGWASKKFELYFSQVMSSEIQRSVAIIDTGML
jgi:hypothetical protein